MILLTIIGTVISSAMPSLHTTGHRDLYLAVALCRIEFHLHAIQCIRDTSADLFGLAKHILYRMRPTF